MTAKNRFALTVSVSAALLAVSAFTISGQTPATPAAPQRGGRGDVAQLPANPIVTPVPTFKAVTGPGEMFPALQRLPAEEDLDHFKYVVKEYFVSGTAQGQPYTTRILVRRPADAKKFSGIVIAEPMHTSGNSWMFHFVHTYAMTQGHISLEIVTTLAPQFQQINAERYKELRIAANQANDILAQVGALIKSNPKNGPLEGLPLRKMTLMGTSASAAIVTGYLPAHRVNRLANMKPIFDGFLPTSQGGGNPLPAVDVPMILLPTMTEVNAAAAAGNKYRRPDGDAPGDQFRIYETAGMGHNDSRLNPTYDPDPCKFPVSKFPEGLMMSMALDHLIQWVDKGKVPPHAPYITVDNDNSNDGSLLALDANGNPKGGVRNPYVDAPTYRYAVPNEANPAPIANPSSIVAGRGAGGPAFYCGIAAYQLPLSPEQLKALYKNKKDYQIKVEQSIKQLTKEGWFPGVYKDLVLSDAAKANIP